MGQRRKERRQRGRQRKGGRKWGTENEREKSGNGGLRTERREREGRLGL